MKRILVIVVLCFVSSSCEGTAGSKFLMRVLDALPFGDRVHFSLCIRKGMTNQQVVDLYGPPPYVYTVDTTGSVTLRDSRSGREEQAERDAGSGRYVIRFKGYTGASAPISHKIYVYLGGFDAIAYVYIGSKGRVERVEIGGT